MVLSSLLESYQLTNVFLFLNWFHALQPEPSAMKGLLLLLASFMEQYLTAPTICIPNPFSQDGKQSLDRTSVKKAIEKEGLECWFLPDLLVNIYRYLDDVPSCVLLAEKMGDVKAQILFRAIQKLNNPSSGLVFENLSSLNLDTFPNKTESKELKELLDIGRLYCEDILEMALQQITLSMEEALKSMEVCIDKDCETQWPPLHKVSAAWTRLSAENCSALCQNRVRLYQRWSWFLLFLSADNMTMDMLKSSLPIISSRVRHVINIVNLIVRFEHAVRRLYLDPQKVHVQAEKILQLGLLMIKFTTKSRDVVGMCLEKAMQELTARKYEEYVAQMQDFLQSAQSDAASKQGAKDADIILPVKRASVSEQELPFTLVFNEESSAELIGNDEKVGKNDKVFPQKKGLFRNISKQTTKMPDFLKFSSFWLEICSDASQSLTDSLEKKFALLHYHWYIRDSKLPWKGSSMQLKCSTILNVFNIEKLKFLSHDKEKKPMTISNNLVTLVDKTIQCDNTFSNTFEQSEQHQKMDLAQNNQPGENQLFTDHGNEECDSQHLSHQLNSCEFDLCRTLDDREENRSDCNQEITDNCDRKTGEIAFLDEPNNKVKSPKKHLSLEQPKETIHLDKKDSVIIIVLNDSKKLCHTAEFPADLDTLNDCIPSLDTYYVPSLPLEVELTKSKDLESFISNYEDMTSADFRFDDIIDFSEEHESDEKPVSVPLQFSVQEEIRNSLPKLLKFNNSPPQMSGSDHDKEDKMQQLQHMQHIQLLKVDKTNLESFELLVSKETKILSAGPEISVPLQLLKSSWKTESCITIQPIQDKNKKEENRTIKNSQNKLKRSNSWNLKRKINADKVSALGNFEISLQKFERNFKKKQKQLVNTLEMEVLLAGKSTTSFTVEESFLKNHISRKVHDETFNLETAARDRTFIIRRPSTVDTTNSFRTFTIKKSPKVDLMAGTFTLTSPTLADNLDETFAIGLDSDEIFCSNDK